MSKDLTQYVTTKQAAKVIGSTQEHIRILLGRKRVKGIKLGHDWLVYTPSLRKYRETKLPKGRPTSRVPQTEASN